MLRSWRRGGNQGAWTNGWSSRECQGWRGLATALVPVSLGVGASVLGAALITRLFASMLAGLSAVDPLTYVAVSFGMLAGAALAGLAAASRLRRVQPADALRVN